MRFSLGLRKACCSECIMIYSSSTFILHFWVRNNNIFAETRSVVQRFFLPQGVEKVSFYSFDLILWKRVFEVALF